MKRRQALLGSNLPRDSRMQVALNNLQREAAQRLAVSLTPVLYYSSFPANALKKPNKMTARSASLLCSTAAYFKTEILQFTLNHYPVWFRLVRVGLLIKERGYKSPALFLRECNLRSQLCLAVNFMLKASVIFPANPV